MSGVAFSHHAVTVAYDTENLASIEGQVIDVFWRNPHIVLTIESISEIGNAETWEVESGSTNSLQRIGIGRDIVSIGDRVSLFGAISRRGLNSMAAYTMTLANGTEVPLWPQRAERIGREVQLVPISEVAQERGVLEARSIFRIWSRIGTGLVSNLPFTTTAIEAREDFDPLSDDPALKCIPPGMPAMMNNPYPIEFVEDGDNILLRLEEWDGVRTINMGSNPSSENQPATTYGFSVGRWEGNALIVTTTRINEPFFDDIGTPQSENIEIVERFTLNENENELRYEVILHDETTFTEPATLSGVWFWKPGEEIKPFECALPDV
tara:strand:+ start:12044 stop:13012 length:969 start_codon:yes stop_codon:yes gene_type:complete